MVLLGMSGFSQRLRSEMEYLGLTRKELAAQSGIHQRALDAYLEAQQSMPPADKAVQIAGVLGLSVEYLVTGKDTWQLAGDTSFAQPFHFRDTLDDMAALPEGILTPIKVLIKSLAENERRKAGKSKR